MSVAFRRDGDEEHLEPKFEIPIPPGPNLVTPRGLALVGEKVAELEKRIDALAAGGAEQAAIDAARRDLRYWQTRQVTAQLVPVATGETVEIGTRVTFRHKGKPRDLAIVGDDEADPALGKVAFSAPLARALMHAQVGDLLAFGGQEDALEVLAIAVER
jgi:transcription elongation GreA/GreB family factor